MKNSENQLLVGLDIGTSEVSVIVCEVAPDRTIEVVGVGQHEAKGMRKGMVSNIEQTVHSIQSAVKEAELMAGCEIFGVFAGITGTHIRSYNSAGVVAIKDNEIRSSDVERVIEAARAVPISTDERILHVIPQAFKVDDQDGIYDPIGMCGVRLEVKVHVITGNASAVQNVLKCIRLCELEAEDVILDQVAAGHSVLTQDEKELGVCLVDIGDGTTDIAIYYDGAIRYTTVIPIAGAQITKDIAITLRTPTSAAEKIKHRFGCAQVSLVENEQEIELPGIGDQPVRNLTRKALAEVIEPRVEELFEHISSEIERTGYKTLIGSGIVFTGGSSKMEGISHLAEKVFEAPVRIGMPTYTGTLSEVVRHPKFSTAIGLCEFGYYNRGQIGLKKIKNEKTVSKPVISFDWLKRMKGMPSDMKVEVPAKPELAGRMKNWFQGGF